LQVCLRVAGNVKGEPHRRQKFACGGFIARHRTRRQRTWPGSAASMRFCVPVIRETPWKTPRMIVPISHAKNITHPAARSAKITKMLIARCMTG
jgi:hypothetical protein